MRSFTLAALAVIAAVLGYSLWNGTPTGLLLGAAVLAVMLGAGHSLLGERALIGPILTLDTLPVILGSRRHTRAVLRFAWHLTSLLWWGIAAVLVVMQMAPATLNRPFLWMIVVVFGFSGVLAVWSTAGRHKSWVYFFAIAALTAVVAAGTGTV